MKNKIMKKQQMQETMPIEVGRAMILFLMIL